VKTEGVEREKPSLDHSYLAEALSKNASGSLITDERLDRVVGQYGSALVLQGLREMRYAPPGSIALPFAHLAKGLEKGWWVA
jgi:hypothetical protein